MTPAEHRDVFDRTFWAVCFSIAIIGSITWLAIFEYNYHPRIYRYGEEVTIEETGGQLPNTYRASVTIGKRPDS
jgi:hypothetical protein